MNRKRHSSASDLEEQARVSFDKSKDFKLNDEAFVTPKMKKYFKAKGIQHAVDPKMMFPSFLACTSNAMNIAQLRFTDTWFVSCNVFLLSVGPKGVGKTPTMKAFLDPLIQIEKEEIKEFDDKKIKRTKKKKIVKKRKSVELEEVEANLDDEGDKSSKEKGGKKGRAKFDEKGDRKKNGVKKRKFEDMKAGESDFEDEVGDETEDEPDQSSDLDEPSSYAESSGMFHRKTRICSTTTQEALVETLRHSSGNLLIKTDEYKGFYEKCVEQSNFESALCSAFSGEDIKVSTCKRGSVTIYNNRLSICGCCQPGVLSEMVNKPDHQGHFDRYILIAAGQDPTVDFIDQLEPIPEEDKLDVSKYLKTIRDHHLSPRTYTLSQEAKNRIIEIKGELDIIDETSRNGPETGGMTSKAITNLLKLSTIFCCARETFAFLETEEEVNKKDPDVKFEVHLVDVEAAWSVTKLSMHTYKSFKVAISKELGEAVHEGDVLTDEEINEDLIWAGVEKIKKLYEKADENREILMSVVRRDKLFPRIHGVNAEVFAKVLVKFKLASKEMKKMKRTNVEVLRLTTKTEDRTTVKLFQMLYESLWARNQIFDPLGIFLDPNAE